MACCSLCVWWPRYLTAENDYARAIAERSGQNATAAELLKTFIADARTTTATSFSPWQMGDYEYVQRISPLSTLPFVVRCRRRALPPPSVASKGSDGTMSDEAEEIVIDPRELVD